MARWICRANRKQSIYTANASAAFAIRRSNSTGVAFELYSNRVDSTFAQQETSDPTQQQGSRVENVVQDKHRNRVSRVKLCRALYSSNPEEHAFAYSNFEEIAPAYSSQGEISNSNCGEISNSNRGEISNSNRGKSYYSNSGEISNSNRGEICKQQSPFDKKRERTLCRQRYRIHPLTPKRSNRSICLRKEDLRADLCNNSDSRTTKAASSQQIPLG